MGRRDTLVAEFGAAVGVLGLLLVFLPLFLERVHSAGRATASMRELRVRMLQSWLVPLTIAVAAVSATTGLLTLWGTADLASATAVLVLIAAWLVVGLAVVAVATVW